MTGGKHGSLHQNLISEDRLGSVESFTIHLHAALATKALGAVELNELGRKLFNDRKFDLAYVCFEVAAKTPGAVGAQVNLGRCEIRLGRAIDAEARARALLENSTFPIHGGQLLGEALMAQRRYVEAVQAFRDALQSAPNYGVLYAQLGEASEWALDPESARAAFERASALNPADMRCLRPLILNKRRVCDWNDLDDLSSRLRAYVAKGGREFSPFDFLSEGASAAEELVCARVHSTRLGQRAIGNPLEPKTVVVPKDGKLRVGFVSCGFGRHPMSVLTVELFEHLRHSALEVHLFATHTHTFGELQRRLEAAAHTFHKVSDLSARDLAATIRDVGIEVLFDLDGYCNARMPETFAYRPAPVQINWLGYPGTIGAAYIEYVIADRFVLPEKLSQHFSEKVVYLDRCFQCNDQTRVIEHPPPRAACALPDEGMVYGCFNTTFKINDRSFTRMLCVLAAVPGSVLWLLKGEGMAHERLREFARSKGIEPGRIVFMDKLANVSYRARYRHVDLFLDTEPYNAHTTASDALWAGCPVLTRPGETFASRVAGSLNHHLGMPEMNMRTDDEFVAFAVKYGNDLAYRSAIREKLERQKRASGLFDMQGYAKDFVELLTRIAAHHRAGGVPGNFSSDISGGEYRSRPMS